MAKATDRPRPAWFRPDSPDLNMRVSDAERAAVADRLARHYGDGRLDKAEFDERVSRAMAAKTFGDIQGLFDDLPDLPGAPSDPTAGGPADGLFRQRLRQCFRQCLQQCAGAGAVGAAHAR